MTNFKTLLIIFMSQMMAQSSFSQEVLTNGDNYYLISMDDSDAAKISSRVVADFRPNNSTNILYIWDNTYSPGTCTGLNSFGTENANWISLIVNSVNWSGAGLNCKNTASLNKLAAITADPANYYLHLAIKSNDNATHLFGIEGQTFVRFAVGSTSFNDNGIIVPAITDFPRDGAWHTIEIPMTTLKQMGLLYSANNPTYSTFGINIFWFLSGGVPGVKLELDAVFIYEKKVNTAIDNESMSANFIVTNKTISLPNAAEPLELYNTLGTKIRTSQESTLGIEDLAKGIYIVRSGKNTIKIRL